MKYSYIDDSFVMCPARSVTDIPIDLFVWEEVTKQNVFLEQQIHVHYFCNICRTFFTKVVEK